MCRKKDRPQGGCDQLDPDSSKWSRSTLLRANAAVKVGFEHFTRAVELAAGGAVEAPRGELQLASGDDLREWYVKHAQVAGIRRFEILTKSASRKERVAKIKMKLKYPSPAIEQRIFERDGYTCVYCGGGVVSRRLLHAFRDVMGIDFKMGTTNADTDGAALVYRGVADHVEPHWQGGATDETNLVTACYPCNFGKAEFTLQELELDRAVARARDGWSGLELHIDALRKVVPAREVAAPH